MIEANQCHDNPDVSRATTQHKWPVVWGPKQGCQRVVYLTLPTRQRCLFPRTKNQANHGVAWRQKVQISPDTSENTCPPNFFWRGLTIVPCTPCFSLFVRLKILWLHVFSAPRLVIPPNSVRWLRWHHLRLRSDMSSLFVDDMRSSLKQRQPSMAQMQAQLDAMGQEVSGSFPDAFIAEFQNFLGRHKFTS